LGAGVGGFAHGAESQIVWKNSDPRLKHDDPPAFVVGHDEEPAAEGVLQVGDHLLELGGGFEIDAVEDEPAGVELLEMADDLRSALRSGDPDGQAASDQLFQGHDGAIVAKKKPGASSLQ
jgi:hypothetical protein